MIEDNKRGRPRKPANSKRSVVRKIFFTPPEWQRVKKTQAKES